MSWDVYGSPQRERIYEFAGRTGQRLLLPLGLLGVRAVLGPLAANLLEAALSKRQDRMDRCPFEHCGRSCCSRSDIGRA